MAEVKAGAPTAETTAVPSATPVNTATPSKKAPGLSFRRFFTKPGVSPYDEIEWEKRTAQITDAKGNVIFEQKDVEVPKDWSMTATNIVASKYLHGTIGTPERETGVAPAGRLASPRPSATGVLSQGYFQHARRRRHLPRRARRTSCCASTPPSIRPSGSTWDATASSPTPTPRTGTGTRQRSASNSASPATRRRSAPPASSTR